MNKNNISHINLILILPKKSRSGFTLNKEILGNILKVSYQTQGRKVTHIFPGQLILDKDFFIGYGLSVGDGLNNPSIRNTHYNFSNSNLDLVHIVHSWLKRYFNIEDCSFQFILFQKSNNHKSIDTIKKLFHVEESRIKIYQSNRHRKDVLTIQISNPIFQLIYLRLFDILSHKMILNKYYRRLFLKGLFAAEGHIKHSIYKTIESVSFSFNPKTEIKLARFIQICLKKDGIGAKIRNDAVYFCNYENMLKFCLLGIMDLHKDKKEKFVRLSKNANVVVHFNNNLLDRLRNKISQRKLAKYLGCSQSTLSKAYKNKYLSLKDLSKLYSRLKIRKENLINYVDYATVRTSFIKDREAAKFLVRNIGMY